MRVATLTTGGKDSTMSLYRVLQRGYDVRCLVTMLPHREDSWMFHYPNINLVDLFAEAVNIPLVKSETTGVKDAELKDLKRVLSRLNIDAVAHGAISSQYQKKHIDQICSELGLKSVAPLWHENPIKLLEEIVSLNIETIIIGVYALGFDQKWLGRRIDCSTISDLVELNKKYQISIVGDGGEYETLVLDAPFFKKKIKLVETEIIYEGQSGYLLVKKAILVSRKESDSGGFAKVY